MLKYVDTTNFPSISSYSNIISQKVLPLAFSRGCYTDWPNGDASHKPYNGPLWCPLQLFSVIPFHRKKSWKVLLHVVMITTLRLITEQSKPEAVMLLLCDWSSHDLSPLGRMQPVVSWIDKCKFDLQRWETVKKAFVFIKHFGGVRNILNG